MSRFAEFDLAAGAEWNGFALGLITPLMPSRSTGAAFIQGPDGARAALQWEMADAPFIGRIEPPGPDHWGVYRVGFAQPVQTIEDILANMAPLWSKLQILYQRARVH